MNYLLKTKIKDIFNDCYQKEYEYGFILYNIAKNIEYKLIKKGDIFLKIGDSEDKFFIILKGGVSVINLFETEKKISIEEYLERIKELKHRNEKFIAMKTIALNKNKVIVDYENIENIVEKIFLKKLYKFIKFNYSSEDLKKLFELCKKQPKDYSINLSDFKRFESDNKLKNTSIHLNYKNDILTKLQTFFDKINKQEKNDQYKIKVESEDFNEKQYNLEKNSIENQHDKNNVIYLNQLTNIDEVTEGSFKLDSLEEKRSFILCIFDQLYLLSKDHFFANFDYHDNPFSKTGKLMSIEDETHIGFINKEIYNELIDNQLLKIESRKIDFLYEIIFEKFLTRKMFEKNYYKSFIYEHFNKGHILFKEKENIDSVYIIFNGKLELSFEKNYFMLEEEIKIIKNKHIQIKKIYEKKLKLIEKEKNNKNNSNYLENFNKNNDTLYIEAESLKKKNLLITKVLNGDILGLENNIFNFPIHYKATVVSDKLSCFKIDFKTLIIFLKNEKNGYKIFKDTAIKKLVSYILRVYEISKSFMEITQYQDYYSKKLIFKNEMENNKFSNTTVNDILTNNKLIQNNTNLKNYDSSDNLYNTRKFDNNFTNIKNIKSEKNDIFILPKSPINNENKFDLAYNYKNSDVGIIIMNQSKYINSDKNSILSKINSTKNQTFSNFEINDKKDKVIKNFLESENSPIEFNELDYEKNSQSNNKFKIIREFTASSNNSNYIPKKESNNFLFSKVKFSKFTEDKKIIREKESNSSSFEKDIEEEIEKQIEIKNENEIIIPSKKIFEEENFDNDVKSFSSNFNNYISLKKKELNRSNKKKNKFKKILLPIYLLSDQSKKNENENIVKKILDDKCIKNDYLKTDFLDNIKYKKIDFLNNKNYSKSKISVNLSNINKIEETSSNNLFPLCSTSNKDLSQLSSKVKDKNNLKFIFKRIEKLENEELEYDEEKLIEKAITNIITENTININRTNQGADRSNKNYSNNINNTKSIRNKKPLEDSFLNVKSVDINKKNLYQNMIENLKIDYNVKNEPNKLTNKSTNSNILNSVEYNKTKTYDEVYPSIVTNINYNFETKHDDEIIDKLIKIKDLKNSVFYNREDKKRNLNECTYDNYSKNYYFKTRKSEKIEKIKLVNSNSMNYKKLFSKNLIRLSNLIKIPELNFQNPLSSINVLNNSKYYSINNKSFNKINLTNKGNNEIVNSFEKENVTGNTMFKEFIDCNSKKSIKKNKSNTIIFSFLKNNEKSEKYIDDNSTNSHKFKD